MPTACTPKWKKRTLTAEAIDFFDPGLSPCPDGLRNRCLGLLRDASLDHDSMDTIENRIQSPELTEAEGLELLSYLVQHRKQLHEFYAPSQRMITDHIKKICGL